MMKDHYIDQKNNCYALRLEKLKEQDVYNQVRTAFIDTFSIIEKKRTFKPILEEKIDEAVFFKNDTTECLLIVLQRHPETTLSFGSARIYSGRFFQTGWKFSESIWISFDGYHEKYSDNSFENISQVARYSVLTNGDVDVSGCDIDEYFWFEYMKD
jgi:hypothetical protein